MMAADRCGGAVRTVRLETLLGALATPALLVVLSRVALGLDNVDGRVARRTGTVTPFGARFDGEVDAFLILVLSVAVSREYGAWVLVIGAARYLHLAAEWLVPWMGGPPPALVLLAESFGRGVGWLYRTGAGPRTRRTLRLVGALAAGAVVWAALVAPSRLDQ